MTNEDLDGIDRALRVIVVPDGYSAGAKDAALRFNARLHEERSRFERARATYEETHTVSAQLEIELRASAAMFAVERERLVRFWRLPLRALAG